jgi:hypothetical protein
VIKKVPTIPNSQYGYSQVFSRKNVEIPDMLRTPTNSTGSFRRSARGVESKKNVRGCTAGITGSELPQRPKGVSLNERMFATPARSSYAFIYLRTLGEEGRRLER